MLRRLERGCEKEGSRIPQRREAEDLNLDIFPLAILPKPESSRKFKAPHPLLGGGSTPKFEIDEKIISDEGECFG
ncbi:hypothetical protein CW706_03265 [Candidatus Bathyarchaeota archaeon]|nr:MAG: hypothetical protein CW706_03265 [Candidatus Bathyarchaeota archaeon]